MSSKARAFFVGIFSMGLVSPSWGLSGANFGNEVLSARSAGEGDVGIAAQNEDPATVYSNPAGITQLPGTQMTLGASWENINGSYETANGDRTKEKATNAVVPNFAVTQSFANGTFGAGLSVQSPFGLETHWGGDSSIRYTATDSRLRMTVVTPAVAYQPVSYFSMGAGLDYFDVFDAQLDRHINVDGLNDSLGVSSSGSSDAVSSLRGSGNAWGYHAGLLLQPNDQNALGVSYHSKAKVRLQGGESISGLSGYSARVFGTPNYQTSAYTDITLPQSVQLGYAFKPTPPWTLEADAAWLHWSEEQDLDVRFADSNPSRDLVLNTGNPEVFNLRDAWSFSTGANFKYSEYWQFRGGFFYEPWAMPEGYFTPALMDLSRYGVAVGAGFNLTNNFTIDAAYSAVFFHNRSIQNNVGASGGDDVSATYKDFANLLSLNFTLKFGQKEMNGR